MCKAARKPTELPRTTQVCTWVDKECPCAHTHQQNTIHVHTCTQMHTHTHTKKHAYCTQVSVYIEHSALDGRRGRALLLLAAGGTDGFARFGGFGVAPQHQNSVCASLWRILEDSGLGHRIFAMLLRNSRLWLFRTGVGDANNQHPHKQHANFEVLQVQRQAERN